MTNGTISIVREIPGRSFELMIFALDFTTKIVMALGFFIAADLIKSILQTPLQ